MTDYIMTTHSFRRRAINISINIKFKSDVDYCRKDILYSYYHPKNHEELNVSSYTFDEYNKNLGNAAFNRFFRALYHPIQKIAIGSDITRKFNVDIALCAASQTRLGNIEHRLGLGKANSDFAIKPGIHLAINGMPTGIHHNWTKGGGSFARFYVVVDADLSISQQLDPGRKGISNYYMDMLEDTIIDLISKTSIGTNDSFGKFSRANLDTGRAADDDDEGEDTNFEQMIEAYNSALTTYSDDQNLILKKLKKISSFEKIPSTEHETIGLFYDLLGRNIIKGYLTRTISGGTTYDGMFGFDLSVDEDNISPKDSNGIAEIYAQKARNDGKSSLGLTKSKLALCIEFKKNLGEFLNEIKGKTDKDPNTIDILICWDASINYSINGTLYNLGQVIDTQRRYHGVTHKLGLIGLGGYNTEISCIFLKDLIAKINGSSSK
ncbi:MAG: hypothetical protein PHO65_08705 [Sulfurovum sp.]|nr:hypothetical protein [Sulfurovum sp.]